MPKKPSSCIVPGLCRIRRACLSQHSNYGSSNSSTRRSMPSPLVRNTVGYFRTGGKDVLARFVVCDAFRKGAGMGLLVPGFCSRHPPPPCVRYWPRRKACFTPPWTARVRLSGDSVRMASKNFLASHQLDTHLCTEFLHTFCRQHCPSRRVYR